MILYVDIQSRRVVSSPKLSKDLTRIDVKRGDVLPSSIVFIKNGSSVALPEGSYIVFCAKRKGAYEGPLMVFADYFTHVSTNGEHRYDGVIDLRGTELQALLDGGEEPLDDLAFADLHAEVSWSDLPEDTIYSSATTVLRVYNDVFKGAEAGPTVPENVPYSFPYGIRTSLIQSFDGGVIQVSGTLSADHIHGNIAGNVYTHVRAGENLFKGDPVYVSGSHGSGSSLIPIVSRADASNPAKMPAIGIMDAAVSNNANGHMVIVGVITEINTAAYQVNQELYVANGGGTTNVAPISNLQVVGRVERSNTNNGAIIVKVSEISGWNSITGKPSEFPPSAHTHSISQVVDLQTALDGKQPTGSYVVATDSRLTDAREWTAETISQAEAEAGTSTTRRAFTAQRVFQAIAAWWNASAFKVKLDGIANGATANQTDAYLLSRTNHTGTQTASTISDFNTAVASTPPASHTHGNITNDGRIGTTSNLVVTTTTGGALTVISRSGIDSRTQFPPASHVHGNITSTGAIGVTSGLPLITGISGVITTSTFGTTSGTFAEGNHAHGNITNDGRVGTDVDRLICTALNGVVTQTFAITNGLQLSAGILSAKYGTTAQTVCQGNDSRLSDARTPLAHDHGNITNTGAIGTTANLPLITTTGGTITVGSFGSISGTFCAGDDSRLSDAREWIALTISQTEAEAGTAMIRRAWTAERVRQASSPDLENTVVGLSVFL